MTQGWRTSIFAVIFVAGHGGVAVAGEPPATFHTTIGIQGVCVEPATGTNINLDSALSAYGVRTSNLDAKMKEIVLRLAQKMERLRGGPFESIRGLRVVHNPNLSILAQQSNGYVEMSSRSTANVANYAHEIGHFVGNNKSLVPPRNERWYDSYRRDVPTNCHFTHYCKTHYTQARYRNEEFAEVFAAYLTNPAILKNKCPDSYNFMRTKMFPAKETSCANGQPVDQSTPDPTRPILRNVPKPEDCPEEDRNLRNIHELNDAVQNAAHVTNSDSDLTNSTSTDWNVAGNQALKTGVGVAPLFMQMLLLKQQQDNAAALAAQRQQLLLTPPTPAFVPYNANGAVYAPSMAPADVPLPTAPVMTAPKSAEPKAKATVVPGP